MRTRWTSRASRRRFIALSGVGITALFSGCLGNDSDDNSDPGVQTESPEQNETTTEPATDRPDIPEVTFQFKHYESTHIVDVFHDGGDPITAENTGELEVTGDATAGPLVVDEDSEAPYEPGQELFPDINLYSEEVIRVQWRSNDGERTETLGVFKAP